MYKVPLFCSWTLHVWPISIFCSQYHYNIVKRTGIKWEQGPISTACKGHYFLNTKLSKLTKWEMYGKHKNSYENLVSELKGQLISAQSLLYIIYAYWQFENICASFSWISTEWVEQVKNVEKKSWKVSLRKACFLCFVTYIALPVSQHLMSFCETENQKHAVNYKTSIFENLEDSIL